jgi:hypothetical protein
MAAPAPRNPLFGFARAMGLLLLVPVGILAALAILFVLLVVGVETVYFFHNRPNDIASMAAKSGVDLASDAGSLDQLKAALGAPEGQIKSQVADNAIDYWWWHDEAVRVMALGDTPLYIDVGERGNMQLLPYARPAFPGSFLGLRIGQPAPSPAAAAALEARARDCCNAESFTWDARGGRITAIHFRRAGFYYQYMGK